MDIGHGAQVILGETGKFLVFSVGIGYLLRRIVGDFLWKEGKFLLIKTERDAAIVAHYMKQAAGEGHQSASVLDCNQDKCQVFHSVSAVV